MIGIIRFEPVISGVTFLTPVD